MRCALHSAKPQVQETFDEIEWTETKLKQKTIICLKLSLKLK